MFVASLLPRLNPCFSSRFAKILTSDCATILKHKTIFAARINSSQTFLSPCVRASVFSCLPAIKLKIYLRVSLPGRRGQITTLLNGEIQLRSKRELIEEFIDNHLPPAGNEQEVEAAFSEFWDNKREAHLARVSTSEGIPVTALREIIDEYQFNNRSPSRDEPIAQLDTPPNILQRVAVAKRLLAKIMEVVAVFEDELEG
jgi:hypothetical protein